MANVYQEQVLGVTHRHPGGIRPTRQGQIGAALLLIGGLSIGLVEAVADDTVRHYQIPAQSLNDALMKFASESKLILLFNSEQIRGIQTQGLNGDMPPEQALQQLLQGSGYTFRFVDSKKVTLEKNDHPLEVNTLPAVNVIGRAVYDATNPYNPDYLLPNATTATKTDTPIMDTPASVQVIPGQVLRDQQAIRLDKALENVSGVIMGSSGTEGNFDQFSIRGFHFGDALYRNGVRFPVPDRGGSTDLSNIERVEVLKGPGAILYGRMEPGGVVNYVTKQPLSTPYYALNQQFGSYDLYRTTADATGPLTEDGDLAYRLNFGYENSDSYRQFVHTDRKFFAPTLSWNLSPKTKVNFELEYRDFASTVDPGLPVVGPNGVAPVPYSANFGEASDMQLSNSVLVGMNWSHAFNDDWTLRHRFNAEFADNDFQLTQPIALSWFDSAFGPGTSAAFFGVDADDHSLVRASQHHLSQTELFYNSLDLTGKFETFGLQHTLLLGGDYFRQETLKSDLTNYPARFSDIYNPVHGDGPGDFTDVLSLPSTTDWYGFYVQDQIKLPYNVQLLAGFRYDQASFSRKQTDVGPDGSVFFDTAASRSEDAVTPRFGLLWRPIDAVSIYGSYTENFGATNLGAINRDNQLLPAQTAQQYEVGIKTELFDKRFIGSATYFVLTKQNISKPDPFNPSVFSIAVGEVKSKGFEVDISGELLPQWKIIASYAHIQAMVTQDRNADGICCGLKGEPFSGVPRDSGSVWSTYEWKNHPLAGLTVGAGTVLRSSQYGNFATSVASGAVAPFSLPGYGVVNLMAGYRFKLGKSTLHAQLNLDNLLDKSYLKSFDGSSFNAYPGSPRTFMGSIGVEF